MTKDQTTAFSSPDAIRDIQNQKLKQLFRHLADHSAFYKKKFKEESFDPSLITLDNLSQLSFTTKDDLARHNDDFLCIPKKDVADFITTSGTLGDPVTFYLSEKDLDRLAFNEAVSLQCAGVTTNDIIQLTTTIDKQFMAGLAYYLGARKLGTGIIRIGPGTPYAQWESIKRFSPTVIIAIPSFIPKLINYATEHNIDYKNCSVKSIVCIGEPVRKNDFELNELGKFITGRWDVKLYSTYASTEMGAAFTECEAGQGGHHQPELLVVEIVDEHGAPAKNGELGEVVITSLEVEGMPLVRYKTGDLCHVHYHACSCGRNTLRLGPIVGRKQHMIKYKGTTIFPPAIFDVLDMLSQVELYQVEVSKNEFDNDDIKILLASEIMSPVFEAEIQSLFKSRLRVTPEIIYLNKEELSKRIFKEDRRKPEKIRYV